jgi:hypothetical protein
MTLRSWTGSGLRSMADQLEPRPLSPLRQAYADAQANVRELLEAQAQRRPESSASVSLERDSRGVTKPSVSVKVGEEFPTLGDAVAACIEVYDQLRMRYPLPGGLTGSEGAK